MVDTLINIGLVLSYLLMVIAIVALIVFPSYQLATNFQRSKGGILGLAGILVVFLIAYFLSPAHQGDFYEKFGIGPSISKLIGAGILGVYIFFAGIVVSLLYFELVKWFK